VLEAFFRKFSAEKISDPAFLQNFYLPLESRYAPEIVQEVFTPGRCLDSILYLQDSLVLCNNSWTCCFTKYHMYLDSATGHLDSTKIFSEPQPERDQYMNPDSCLNIGCHAYCNEFHYGDISDTSAHYPDSLNYCEIDGCDTTYTDEEIILLNYGGCSGCKVTFKYRIKKCPGDTSFVDIVMDQAITENCNNCMPPLNTDELFMRFLDAVLKDYGNDKFPEDKNFQRCDTNVRVSHASCWGFFEDNAWKGNPVNKTFEWLGEYQYWQGIGWVWVPEKWYVYRPCPPSNCCWAVFIICKDPHPANFIHYEYYYGSSDTVRHCQISPAPCDFVCGNYEPPIPIINSTDAMEATYNHQEFLSYVFPNPNEGKMNLYIESKLTGSLKVVVFDLQGNFVNVSSIEKTSLTQQFELNLKHLTNGKYFYTIYAGNNKVGEGKFNLIK
jgi:hypothetical protein